MSAAATERTIEPGLDLSWLNIDDGWGTRAEAGAKGMTLDNLRKLPIYGEAAPDAGRPTSLLRGGKADPRTPSHRNQYKTKSDVWSDSALLLYEEAMQRQWSSATDIPWDEIKELPDDIEMAMCTLCTFLTQVEFIAGDLPGRFMGTVHPEQFETQLFLGTQLMDESRHEDVFRKRALVNGGGLVDAGFGASQLLSADDFTEMTARLHLVGEGFVQTIFRMGELISNNDAEKRIFRLSAQDESRHLAFGVTHLKYLIDVDPDRKEQLHHYLDIQEGALGQSQGSLTTNPATSEALAVLAGGGLKHIDEGFQKLLIMRKKQINEYMHRLEVIGLGDRRERMAPSMKVFLEA